MGIGLVNESFIPKEAREAHKVCLQSLMTVQHQLEVYIELIVNFCASSAKKVVHVIVSNLLCPRAVLKSIIKNRISIIDYQKLIIKNRISIIDYQKSIIKNRISKIDYQIDCQRSFTCKSKINCKKSIIKNRSSKIDFILDAHAYHILPEFCRKRRSIVIE